MAFGGFFYTHMHTHTPFLLSLELCTSVLTFSSHKLFFKTYLSAKFVLLSVNRQWRARSQLSAVFRSALKVKPVF